MAPKWWGPNAYPRIPTTSWNTARPRGTPSLRSTRCGSGCDKSERLSHPCAIVARSEGVRGFGRV